MLACSSGIGPARDSGTVREPQGEPLNAFGTACSRTRGNRRNQRERRIGKFSRSPAAEAGKNRRDDDFAEADRCRNRRVPGAFPHRSQAPVKDRTAPKPAGTKGTEKSAGSAEARPQKRGNLDGQQPCRSRQQAMERTGGTDAYRSPAAGNGETRKDDDFAGADSSNGENRKNR